MGKEAEDKVLSRVDEPRRAFLKKLILGTAFAVPAVASFSMSGLSVTEARVQTSNQFPTPVPTQASTGKNQTDTHASPPPFN